MGSLPRVTSTRQTADPDSSSKLIRTVEIATGPRTLFERLARRERVEERPQQRFLPLAAKDPRRRWQVCRVLPVLFSPLGRYQPRAFDHQVRHRIEMLQRLSRELSITFHIDITPNQVKLSA